jgi:hypothetical protein
VSLATSSNLSFHFFACVVKQLGNHKNVPDSREVTQRQRELIEEFDKEECTDRERVAAASG